MKKPKKIKCIVCNKIFFSDKFINFLNESKCCKSCFIKLKEKYPNLYGKFVIEKYISDMYN